MNSMAMIILTILFSALIIFDILISILGYLRSKKHSRHILSNGIMNRMADIMTGCPIEFIYKHSKLISSSSTYRLEPADNDRIIIGHNLVPDPYYGDDRMLTIFITNSSVFPYFLADECDLIDLVDARIHFKGYHTTDDNDDCCETETDEYDTELEESREVNDNEGGSCCVTAVDGHIEDSKDICNSCDHDDAYMDMLTSANRSANVLTEMFGLTDDSSNSQ